MRTARHFAILLVMSYLCTVFPAALPQAPPLKGRGVWAGPRDAGTSEQSVIAFVGQLEKAHVNTVILEFKGGAGLCWPSSEFPDAVNSQYKTFDMPAVLIRECHKRNIQVHAWFFDFAEGADSYVVRQHPEWLALNPEGKPTTAEVLRGSPYRLAWMCPARRPGYTDQWLIPVIKDFVRRYEVDAIHHDYVRYPGDLAPDQYCFCDYCLQHIPEYASYVWKTYPDRPFYPVPMDRPHLEAHWEKGPRVLPGNWNDYSREMKSRFLLGGSFFPGGNHDLDYFFYEYRVEAVKRFVREVYDEVRGIRPKVEVSAAVFKDPIHSARFIGQDWRRFAPWVQYAMPMDYRSHYPGDFETHLALLEESILRQKELAADFRHLWIGIATSQLYDEEREPLTRMRQLLSTGASGSDLRSEYDRIAPRLKQWAPELVSALQAYVADPKDPGPVRKELQEFLGNTPPGFYPPEKLSRTMHTVRRTGVEGIVIFSAGGIRSAGLWDTVAKAFE